MSTIRYNHLECEELERKKKTFCTHCCYLFALSDFFMKTILPFVYFDLFFFSFFQNVGSQLCFRILFCFFSMNCIDLALNHPSVYTVLDRKDSTV